MKQLLFLVGIACSAATIMHAQSVTAPALVKTILLPGVLGKFDHLSIDQRGARLFAAATTNQSVEVVDLASGKVIDSLKGFGKPHGLLWLPDVERLFVADGVKAEVDVFAGAPLKQIKSIPLSEDADDMAYDEASHLLYVGHGGSPAAAAQVAVIDVRTITLVANLPMPSHPESLEYDAVSGRIFVNLAEAGKIAVIDGSLHTIVATWTLKHAKGNTPLAFDAQDSVLLAGCRTPSSLLSINASSGHELTTVPASAGADDLFYDGKTHQAYLITGSGAFQTFAIARDGALSLIATTLTAPGAKTGILDATHSLLYVAIPGTQGPASINVYHL